MPHPRRWTRAGTPLFGCLTLGLTLALTPGQARADSPPVDAPVGDATQSDQERIAELEALVLELRAEIAELRAQLQAADDSVDAATPSIAVDPDEPGDVSPVRNIGELLRLAPRDSLPGRRGEWTDANRVDANRWMAANAVGRTLDARLEVADVRVSPNPFHTLDEDAAEWQVNIDFVAQPYPFGSTQVRQIVTIPTLYGSEDFAERARRIQPEYFLPVRGRINTLELGALIENELDARIELTGVSIDSPLLRGLETPYQEAP